MYTTQLLIRSHLLTHSLTHSLTYSLSHSHITYTQLNYSFTLTYSLIHSLIHSHTHSATHTHPLSQNTHITHLTPHELAQGTQYNTHSPHITTNTRHPLHAYPNTIPVPGRYLWGFFGPLAFLAPSFSLTGGASSPSSTGAVFLAATVGINFPLLSSLNFLGAFPPVDFLAVCFVLIAE